jgi:hypothetical protein
MGRCPASALTADALRQGLRRRGGVTRQRLRETWSALMYAPWRWMTRSSATEIRKLRPGWRGAGRSVPSTLTRSPASGALSPAGAE